MAEKKIRVAGSGDIAEGQLHAAEADGTRVLLTRIGGQVRAVVNRCPHMGMKMSRGKLDNGVLQCPWHGSRFDFCTGENVDWVNAFAGVPMPGWTHKIISMGKAPAPLATLAAVEEGDDVYVTVAG